MPFDPNYLYNKNKENIIKPDGSEIIINKPTIVIAPAEEQKLKFYDGATIGDFEELKISDRTKYDHRDFWLYLRDLAFSEHPILSMFFKRSLYYPPYLLELRCFTYIFFVITINTVLFTDSDISVRNGMEMDPNVRILYFIL